MVLRNWFCLIMCIGVCFIITPDVKAQDDIIEKSKTLIKTGNSKELSRYFNDLIDLGFDGERASYSKIQAEFVLRDFFKKYPPVDFQFVHKGSSKEGLIYTIGNYTHTNGSFRVLIYIKQFKGNFLIDYLDFSKE